jgi:drug/metabolite transporter (DMT)-like permease
VVGFDIGITNRDGLLGAGMVLLAGVGYACATFLVRHKLSGVAPLGVAAGTMTIATVVLAPAALLTAPVAMPSAKATISVVVLGLFSTALALVLFYRMIAMAGAGSASLVSYTSPAVAVLLGVVVLSEPLTPVTLLGFGLILTGSWLSTRRRTPLVSPDEPAAPGNAAPRRDLGTRPATGDRQPGLAAGSDGVQAVPDLQDGPQLAAGVHLHRAGTVTGAER